MTTVSQFKIFSLLVMLDCDSVIGLVFSSLFEISLFSVCKSQIGVPFDILSPTLIKIFLTTPL